METTLKIETIGTLLSEFKELHGNLQIYSCGAEDDLVVTGTSTLPVIIFSRHHSNVQVTHNELEYHISPSNFLLLNGGTFKIEKLTPTWQVSVLCSNNQLMAQTANTYSLENDTLKTIFSTPRLLPRKNWLNEVLHRFYFAKSIEKVPDNHAINFLELEIIKETYYTYLATVDSEQRDIFPIGDKVLAQLPPELEECVLYIENNLFTNFNLEKLSKLAKCSPRTLQRLFSKYTKKNIRQYILDRKLQEAHLILRSSNHSIGEVASIVGYESVSTFIRMFKRKFGVTPGQIIQDYRKNIL